MTNIKATLAEANSLAGLPKCVLSSVGPTKYVRHRADLTQIRAELAYRVGARLSPVDPQADACSHDRPQMIATTAARPFVFMTPYWD